jgi:competence ComEA-like helix-hairpin-helix protein
MSKSMLAAVGLCVCISMALRAAPARLPGQNAVPDVKNDPDLPTFERICADCHDAQRVLGHRRSTTDWEDILNKMIEKGASGSEADFESIFKFLSRNFGRVAINRAPSAEISLVLTLSSKDADAIVAYRKEHGDFANFDALLHVPGIDATALAAHKDAVIF